MRLFLDSVNIDEIKDATGWGVISGVTVINGWETNAKQLVNQICRLIEGPVAIQVSGKKAGEMIKEGREFASWHPSLNVRIPLTEEGVKAIKILSNDGIKTDATLIFSPNQALLAAIAGATFVSPFIGYVDDTGFDGTSLIEEIRTVYDHYVFSTQIITAGIRHQLHVSTAAKIGSDIATVPYEVMKKIFNHPLTIAAEREIFPDKVKQGV